MNVAERKAVAALREKTRDLLTPKYDTDFNLARWAIGHNFDLDEAAVHLIRHLKLRRFHDLDAAPSIPLHPILDKYFPIKIIGETGRDNTLLVAECAGRIDLKGILKAVQLSDFLNQRYSFQERVLEQLNEMERRTGRQASVVYILDLDGLKLDSWLLSVVTGPYRILWASVYTNYPEWISTMFIINCPPFMSLLWKAIYPLLPERTREKIQICTTASEAKTAARQLIVPSRLPAEWGGDLVGNKAAVAVATVHDPIPSSMYWKPDENSPAVSALSQLVIPARKSALITYTVEAKGPIYLVLNRFCDRTFGQTLYYCEELDDAVETEKMRDWAPYFDFPGMPTVDRMRERLPGPGTVRICFSNEGAWIRSLDIRYRVLFENEEGEKIPFTESKIAIQ